jgi:hypothetical protein
MSAFATALELEQFIGAEPGEPSPRAASMLNFGAALLRRWTGQTLSAVAGAVETVPIAYSGAKFILLRQRPVVSIATVVVGGVGVTGYTFTRWGRVDYESGLYGVNAVVTYTHGYTASDPEWETLKLLNMQIAARALTYFRSPKFEELGGAPSDTAGFAPELFLSAGEQKLLADLGKVPVG